ncbi:hypothetical protein ACFV7Q_05600 [Streptomyces sp. NPDC059851]|uniref:hypothetical protein n=1 Tax=Streptomyces sp. NPDC059851 TaxID=3346971 RepID=UPI0036566405
MRLRQVLASVALGTALALGTAAVPAQAAQSGRDAHSDTIAEGAFMAATHVGSDQDVFAVPNFDANTTTAALMTALDLIRVDTFRTRSACESFGASSAYAFWVCERNGSRWELWVDDDT